MKPEVGRQQILDALQAATEPLPHVLAMWQGGAAAFDRVDEWSDIDVQLGVEDDRVDEVMELVREVLAQLGPLDHEHILPMPTWHGHAQGVFRLANASPYLFVDLVVMKRSSSNRFLEPEIHGNAVVHFDRCGFTRTEPLDRADHEASLQKRLQDLRRTFDLFRVLTLKEIHRGNAIEAHMYYQNFTIRPLIELLRIRWDPTRPAFHARYIHYYLPEDVVAKLMPLIYVKDLADLESQRVVAERLFEENLAHCSEPDAS